VSGSSKLFAVCRWSCTNKSKL